MDIEESSYKNKCFKDEINLNINNTLNHLAEVNDIETQYIPKFHFENQTKPKRFIDVPTDIKMESNPTILKFFLPDREQIKEFESYTPKEIEFVIKEMIKDSCIPNSDKIENLNTELNEKIVPNRVPISFIQIPALEVVGYRMLYYLDHGSNNYSYFYGFEIFEIGDTVYPNIPTNLPFAVINFDDLFLTLNKSTYALISRNDDKTTIGEAIYLKKSENLNQTVTRMCTSNDLTSSRFKRKRDSLFYFNDIFNDISYEGNSD